jgi:hypothetical protein
MINNNLQINKFYSYNNNLIKILNFDFNTLDYTFIDSNNKVKTENYYYIEYYSIPININDFPTTSSIIPLFFSLIYDINTIKELIDYYENNIIPLTEIKYIFNGKDKYLYNIFFKKYETLFFKLNYFFYYINEVLK